MERGNEFKAGQPIVGDEAMNDMPTFADRVRENVPEALEYLEQHPDLKKNMANATRKLEELNQLLESENINDAEAANSTFVSAVETFNNVVRRNKELENKLEDHEIRKLDGEYSEAEYDQAVADTKSQFVNEGDKLAAADAGLVYNEAIAKNEAAKAKLDDLETRKLDGDLSEEEYQAAKAAADQEIADNDRAIRESQAVLTSDKLEDVQAAAKAKLDDLETRKLDGDLSEEEYQAAKADVEANLKNAEGSTEVAKAVNDRKAAETRIVEAKKALDSLETQMLDGQLSKEEYDNGVKKLNDEIEASQKIVEESNAIIENSRFEATSADAPEGEPKGEDPELVEARAAYKVAEQLNKDARAEMEAIEKSGKTDEETNAAYERILAKIHDSEKAMRDMDARIKALENAAAGTAEAGTAKPEGAEAGEAKPEGAKSAEGEDGKGAGEAKPEGAKAGAEEDDPKGEKDNDPEWKEFFDNYFNDEAVRGVYTRNGVFDEESCRIAVRNFYVAKKKNEAAEKAAAAKAAAEAAKAPEGDDGKPEKGEGNDDDFENDEQRGLFAKLKNFFKGNKRSKTGAERALKEGKKETLKKTIYAALLALVTTMSIGSALQNAGLFDRNTAPEPTKIEAEDTGNAEVDLNEVAEDLSLNVDLNAEKGEELSDLVNTTSYGEDIEVNISAGDYDGTSEFFDYEEKHGQHNLTKELYDMGNEELTDVQKAEQIAEGLANVLDDPVEQGQFAALGGTDVVIGDREGGITSLADMNEVLDLAQQDDEFRETLTEYNKEMYRDMVDNYDLQVEHRAQGTHHRSLYAYEMQLEDGTSDINYAIDKDGVLAREDFDALQFVDEDGQNILDKNDIGGYKYNFLKAIGIIAADATDEEAQDVMSKIRIIGFSGKCGQLIWENITPDTGSEGTGDEGTGREDTGDEGTGTENEDTGDEGTGTENEGTGDEGTGTENEGTGDEGTGTENEGTGDEGTGTEGTGTEGTGTEGTGTEGTGTEGTGTEGTGTEGTGTEGTGTEGTGTEGTGTEGTGDEYDGKTDILPGEPGDGWTVIDHPTPEETGPVSEAGGDNGYVNDNTPGSSSEVAQDDFLNGGDQGGGNTDADGGGSNNPETEATYDGSDTSGWKGDTQSEEPGTQDIQEPSTPEEVNAVNDSQANQESAGENASEDQIREDHDAMMDRF